MAVEVERGFCMRGYVAKMRSVDMAKCRPFDGESLPPMDVRMFRWWSDEAAPPQPAKPRTGKKKKRSIVELFAVSPQINGEELERREDGRSGEERVEEVTGGEGLYYANLESVSKREGLESELQGKDCGVERKKMNGKKVKNGNRKKKLQIKFCVARKEKKRKAEISSSLSLSQLIQEAKCKKTLKKSLEFSINSQNKNKKSPSILSGKELKLSPKSEANPKSQIKNCSVQSILKKQVKSSPLKKHVTFLEKDDLLERNLRSSSPVGEQSDLIHEKLTQVDKLRSNLINETLIKDTQKENSSLRKPVDLNQLIDLTDSCIEIRADEIKTNTEITKEPSSSCLINNKSQNSHNNFTEQNQLESPIELKSQISNKDVISVSSSTGSNKSCSTETRLNNNDCISNNISFSEEYIGLPLNSQGELALNPNSHPNPNSISNPNYRPRCNSGGFLCPNPVTIMPKINPSNNINNMNRANLQIGPLYCKDTFGTEHYYMPVRPGFRFANMPGFEAMEIQNFPSSSEQTVRLMGKNVRLGKNTHEINNALNGGTHVSNGYRTRPANYFNPNFNPINRFGQSVPAQQILLNSQSQHMSFASSSDRVETSLPQWIVNPKSKTHKPAFPSYTNTNLNSTNIPHPCLIYDNNNNNINNNNNLNAYYPLVYHPHVRPNYNHPKNQPNSKFNFIKPSDYINPNPQNKRPVSENQSIQPISKQPRLETGSDSIPNPTRPDFNPSMKAQTRNTDPNQSELSQSKLGVGWTGPVKLSGGARHVLKPGLDTDSGGLKPVYCAVPLTCGPGSSQKSCSEIYRF